MKIAVVTGAARGIGLAVARALLRDGFAVHALDVDAGGLERRASELAGQPFHPQAVDLTDPEAVRAAFRRIDEATGGPDALVNNAGTCFMSAFPDTSPEELRRQIDVNFSSAFYCCQQAVPRMKERPGIKKIVNISSNGAYNFDVFDPAHYRASKAALDTLTKDLARRYARDGIAVNSLAPAMTETDLFGVVPEADLAAALAAMPRGRPMRPEEIADWVAFLVSPAGDVASGNVILLNQGRDVR